MMPPTASYFSFIGRPQILHLASKALKWLTLNLLQILPEAGHLAWAGQPELFADMIIDWVEIAHK